MKDIIEKNLDNLTKGEVALIFAFLHLVNVADRNKTVFQLVCELLFYMGEKHPDIAKNVGKALIGIKETGKEKKNVNR